MIKTLQKELNIPATGKIDDFLISQMMMELGTLTEPEPVTIGGNRGIACKDILVFNPNSGTKNFSNCISGSFSYGQKPCSIMVNNGVVKWESACHAWANFPEAVLYRMNDGGFGMVKVKYASELPKNIDWAVGGVGLGKFYNPNEEGFCKFTHNKQSFDYSDVLRKTNHTAVAVKNGLIYLFYFKGLNGKQVNNFMANTLEADFAVMLDGGHVASMNCEAFKTNTSQKQYFAIQGI